MPTIHAKGNQGPGIPVNLFNAKTGKFLFTQTLQYKTKNNPSNYQIPPIITHPESTIDQITSHMKNHLLEERQMVLTLTTMDNVNFISKNSFNQLKNELDLDTQDTCMQDSTVAPYIANSLVKTNAMQNDSSMDESTPTTNPTPYCPNPPP